MNWYRFTPAAHEKSKEKQSLTCQWELSADSREEALMKLQMEFHKLINLDSFSCKTFQPKQSIDDDFKDFDKDGACYGIDYTNGWAKGQGWDGF